VPPAVSQPSVLAEILDDLCRHYDRRFLESDPVGIVRTFDDAGDREIVGLVAAGLAYGRVASIRGSLERLLIRLGPRPSRFVTSFDPAKDASRLDGFVHRFTRGRDVALLLHLVRQARERAGSLESFFIEGDPDPASPTLGPALDSFGARLFALDARPFVTQGPVPRGDGARWLLPVPGAGSACKRSCLFLRWMVRRDDGVDCGVWSRVSPSRLVLPLDTHLVRVVRALGWTRRKSPGWRMALEATSRLRALDAHDPIRFDFALSRLGILGLIPARGGRLSAQSLRRAMTSR
jgi:uncharacterized protein (TIGR02757 family)